MLDDEQVKKAFDLDPYQYQLSVPDEWQAIRYAAGYWASHFEDSQIATSEPIMADIMQLYIVNSKRFRYRFLDSWVRFGAFKGLPTVTQAFAATACGHDQVLRIIFDTRPDKIASDQEHLLALLAYSCRTAKARVVKTLLKSVRNINARAGLDSSPWFASLEKKTFPILTKEYGVLW